MALSACQNLIADDLRELVNHGTELFPVACYHDDLSLDGVAWHFHEELELILVSEGMSEIAVGHEKFLVRKGQGFFINTGILHSAWNASEGSCQFHSVVFHPRLVGGSQESIFWQNYLRPLTSPSGPKRCFFDLSECWHKEALEALEQCWQACYHEPAGYEFTVRESLSRIIFLLWSHLNSAQSVISEKAVRDAERMKTMLTFIQSHLRDPLTTTAIAGSASISVSECLRCFHNTIGSTPIQYLKQARIQEAADLLRLTDLKVSQIGERCGFQEMSYFAKTFRELRGCTPTEYREKGR